MQAGAIERQLDDKRFKERLNQPKKTVKERPTFLRVADLRDNLADKLGDVDKWLDKAFDKEKYKELESFGGPVKMIRSIHGWVTQTFPEPKELKVLDTVLSLYDMAWKAPVGLAKGAGFLWYVIAQKLRNEKKLTDEKAEAAAFGKDPVAFVRKHKDLFETIDLEVDQTQKIAELVLGDGLIELTDTAKATSAIEFTTDPPKYGENTTEFKSYVDIRAETLVALAGSTGQLDAGELALLQESAGLVVAEALKNKIANPNSTVTVDDINFFAIPNAPVLAQLLENAHMTEANLIGNFDSAFAQVQSMAATANISEVIKGNDRAAIDEVTKQKSLEFAKIFELSGDDLPVIANETAYVLNVFSGKLSDEDALRTIEADTLANGVSPIANILRACNDDLSILRSLLTSPVGQFDVLFNQLFSGVATPLDQQAKLKIYFFLKGTDTYDELVANDIDLAATLEAMTGKNFAQMKDEEINAEISLLRGQLSDTEGRLMRQVNGLSLPVGSIDVEIYSFLNLPPFASKENIETALNPFNSLNESHKAVIDTQTGRVHERYSRLQDLFIQLNKADPGLLEDLVATGFFFYRGRDKAALAASLKAYKSRDLKKLRGLEGDADQGASLPSINNFFDLNYSAPTHGIKFYFDRIYAAAERAGINQSFIDTLIVEKSTFNQVKGSDGKVKDDVAESSELAILALYVNNPRKVLQTAEQLNKVVSTANVLISNPKIKEQYDVSIMKAVQRDEGISDRQIERQYIRENGTRSGLSTLNIPRELETDPRAFQMYKDNLVRRSGLMRQKVNATSMEAYIDRNIMTDLGAYTAGGMSRQAQTIGNLFLNSPVDAQRFDDTIFLMLHSRNFNEVLLEGQLPQALKDTNSPLAKEVLAALGLTNTSPDNQKTVIKQLVKVAQRLYNKVINSNMDLLGFKGDGYLFDSEGFAHFVSLFLGDLHDYANGTLTVKDRVARTNSLIGKQAKNVELSTSSAEAVPIRRALVGLSEDYMVRQANYEQKVKNLTIGNELGARQKAVQSIRTERFNPAVFDKDSRTVQLMMARRTLNTRGKRFRKAEDRLGENYVAGITGKVA